VGLIVDKNIIYLGPFSFPNGGAAARRILGVSKSLESIGCKVTIASGQCEIDGPKNSSYEGIDVISLNERTAENLPKILKYLFYFTMGKKTIKWLDSLEKKPSAIILYSGYSPYFLRLLPWCKRNNIPLIFDAVEWYDPPTLFQGIINPYYWNIELAMRFLSPKAKNIIAISKYLESYYQSEGCHTVRIPPTLDVVNTETRSDVADSSLIKLGYTGSPGHKDLLNNVLTALCDLDINGKRLHLKIAGITTEQLLNYPALKNLNLTELPACMKCFGVVSQTEALKIIKDADFSVLLRPNKRYAKAGFPTKFVESLTVGTPVIANHTSDLADYLIDEKTGVVCADEQVESLKAGLERIQKLDIAQLKMMRIESRKMALNYFDVNGSKEIVLKFIYGLHH
jgi:glycosyltransferase involved in cell wall biosynthesis